MDPDKADAMSETREYQDPDKPQPIAASQPVVPIPDSLTSLTPDELARLGRRATLKMDMAIMPIVVIMYILNYLDRQNIASAKLAGLEEDLNMNDTQYQTAVSILFVGYILMQVPSNMILGVISWPGLYICVGVGLWGTISACMAAAQNFSGLIAARFFIGIVEAIFYPGAIFHLSLFYSKQQLAFRTAILFSGSQLGNAFGGLFAVAIMKLDGVHGLAGWRWLFLVEGVMTAGLAIIFAFLLPNSIDKIIGVSKVETDWLKWNYLESNATASRDESSGVAEEEVTAWRGLVMAVSDVKTWMVLGLLSVTYIDGAVSNFFPSVVGGLGFDRNTTYLLTAPPFILCVIVMWVNGWNSDRVQERYMHIVWPLILCLVANIIAVSTVNVAARYVAIMLLPSSIYASAIITQSWVTGTLAQPRPKRAAVIALVNAFANTPNIWASYLYGNGPRYLEAFIVNIIAAGLAIGLATITHLYLKRLNKKLDRGEDLGKHGPTPSQLDGGFRYIV
jgi:predicted MFS family arabinose efflux permease